MEVAPYVAPDIAQAQEFFRALFPNGGLVHFRAVPEPKDSRPPTNHFYDVGDPELIAHFVNYCHAERRAAFFLPGTSAPGKTGKDGVLSLPAVLVDLDKGDTRTNLERASAEFGVPTMIVRSGGTTEEGKPKLHAYWVLEEPATGDAINAVCHAREQLALKFGGDPAFKQPAQIIRIPGSVHFKGTPKLVRLDTVQADRYKLAVFTGKLGGAPAPAKPAGGMTFNDLMNLTKFKPPQSTADRALTAPIEAEGKSGITRFEGATAAFGHWARMVREGKMTEDEARKAAHEWNVATLQPPWEPDRIDREFNAVLALDRKNNPAPDPVTGPDGFSIEAWRSDIHEGEPPPREWIVKGVLPRGTAGIFASVGDAGKSMMVLKLGLDIAIGSGSFPPHFFGGKVATQGTVVILTAEDDRTELHRRLHALDPTNQRKGKPLYVVPMISAGGLAPLVKEDASGAELTEFFKKVATQLAKFSDLRLVVFDPASVFVAGDLNGNELGAMLMSNSATLAAELKATVMWVHHFNKSKTSPSTLAEARESIRGAGALVDNARWALVLWEADEDDRFKALDALGQKARAMKEGVVYKGGVAKSNAPAEKRIRTFVRNDKTGLLEDATDAIKAGTPAQAEQDTKLYNALLALDDERIGFTFPRSRKALDENDLLGPLVKATGLSANDIDAAMVRLIDDGKIKRTDDKAKRYSVVR